MDRMQIVEESFSIEEKMFNLQCELENLAEAISQLKKTAEKKKEMCKRHKTWHCEAVTALEKAEDITKDAFDNIDNIRDSLREIQL